VHLTNGLPSFTVVGLADIEVKEARVWRKTRAEQRAIKNQQVTHARTAVFKFSSGEQRLFTEFFDGSWKIGRCPIRFPRTKYEAQKPIHLVGHTPKLLTATWVQSITFLSFPPHHEQTS
jgi:hypothetical protein